MVEDRTWYGTGVYRVRGRGKGLQEGVVTGLAVSFYSSHFEVICEFLQVHSPPFHSPLLHTPPLPSTQRTYGDHQNNVIDHVEPPVKEYVRLTKTLPPPVHGPM